MKKVLLIALAAVLTIGAAGEAAAQKFEFGLRAGVASQNLDMKFDGLQDAKARLGFHAAAVGRIRLLGSGSTMGLGLYLQPEVVYSQNNAKGKLLTVNPMGNSIPADVKVRMQTIDIPLLVSVKIAFARIQAGPVFNLMNNFSSVEGNLEFTNLRRSPVGYALGASVDVGPVVIDGRYHGDFGKLKSDIKGGDSLVEGVKGSVSSWSLGVGFMF